MLGFCMWQCTAAICCSHTTYVLVLLCSNVFICVIPVQVLMMTESEFKQLQQAEQEEKQDAAAAAAAGSSQQHAQNGSAAHQAVTLNLGRDMLEDEFGELCGAVLLQVSKIQDLGFRV